MLHSEGRLALQGWTYIGILFFFVCLLGGFILKHKHSKKKNVNAVKKNSAHNYEIPAHGRGLCATDIQIELPRGCYGRVAARSGLALNNFIDVGAGVIDQDYRGNLGVIIFNHDRVAFKINRGDRIAQLICEKIAYPTIVECQVCCFFLLFGFVFFFIFFLFFFVGIVVNRPWCFWLWINWLWCG